MGSSDSKVVIGYKKESEMVTKEQYEELQKKLANTDQIREMFVRKNCAQQEYILEKEKSIERLHGDIFGVRRSLDHERQQIDKHLKRIDELEAENKMLVKQHKEDELQHTRDVILLSYVGKSIKKVEEQTIDKHL